MSFFNNLFGSVPSVTITECTDKISQKPAPILLDVRSTEEYRNGHISGATSIPLDRLPTRMNKLSKSREIICICRSGSRSKRATKQLIDAGYQAINLKGGMKAWSKAGNRVKAGKVK